MRRAPAAPRPTARPRPRDDRSDRDHRHLLADRHGGRPGLAARTARGEPRRLDAARGPATSRRRIRDGEPDGYSYVDHMAEVAKAAESAGFVGGLLPVASRVTDDPWVARRRAGPRDPDVPVHGRLPARVPAPGAGRPDVGEPAASDRRPPGLQRHHRRRRPGAAVVGRHGRPRRPLRPDHRVPRRAQGRVGRRRRSTTTAGSSRSTAAACPARRRARSRSRRSTSPVRPAPRSTPAGRHADYYLSWLEPFDGAHAPSSTASASDARAHGPRRRSSPSGSTSWPAHTEEEAWAEVERGWRSRRPRGADSSAPGRLGRRRPDHAPSSPGTDARSYRDLEVQPQRLGRVQPAPRRPGLRPRRQLRAGRRAARRTRRPRRRRVHPRRRPPPRRGLPRRQEVLPRVTFPRTNSLTTTVRSAS